MIVTDKEFKGLKKAVVSQYEACLKELGPVMGWSKQDYRTLGSHEGKLQLLAWFNDYFTQPLHAKMNPETGEVLEMERGHNETDTDESSDDSSEDRTEECGEDS